MAIRILPQALVNQIAAGEVVERPASVAKELLENALDAGAKSIAVSIDGGGRERLSVSDDGGGIARGELALALAPHATSKIVKGEDLDSLITFGFRGEALSAISAVADVTLTSRTAGDAQAWAITCRFGALEEVKPAALAQGSRVDVRGLFSNVPARRRFLRSDPAEAARVTEAVANAALAHPSVAFRLESGSRRVFDLAPTDARLDRVHDVVGEALGDDPIEVDTHAVFEGGLEAHLSGLVARPSEMRSSSRTQRIFVNGRPISDRRLLHAVREAYRGLSEPSLQPAFVLFLDIDASAVDVNVHPQKSEVRWRQPALVHRLFHRAVQGSIRGEDLTASGVSLLDRNAEPPHSAPDVATTWSRTTHHIATSPAASCGEQRIATRAAEWVFGETAIPEVTPADLILREVLQVDNTWLILGEGGDLVIVDQHALHERVMFEEIRDRITRGDLLSQRLLSPIARDLAPESLARLEPLAPLLARLGIDAVAAGPRSIAIHAFPGFLSARKVDAGDFVVRVLENDSLAELCESGDDAASNEAALADVLDMMACKAAVKGGDRLSQTEIARLLSMREKTDRSTNCPHGRPTSVRIPIAEIERRFGRR